MSFRGVEIDGSEVMDEDSANAPAEELVDAAEDAMFSVVESLTWFLESFMRSSRQERRPKDHEDNRQAILFSRLCAQLWICDSRERSRGKQSEGDRDRG